MLGYGVSIGDSISEIEEEQRKKKPLPPISEMADLLLAADGHAVPSAPGNSVSGTSSPLPPISEAADKILSGTAQDASVNSKQLPPISEAADMLLAGAAPAAPAPAPAPAPVPAIDRSEHGNNMALNLNVPEAAKDPLHIGAAAQNAYWNLQESKGNTQAMRAFQLEQAKKENTPGEVVAVNRSGVAPMTPVEEAVMLRQMAAKDRGDTSQTAELEQSLNTRIDELKDEAKRRWASAEQGRVKYDLPDNKFGAAILETIESAGMTVEAALRSGALWALGGPALGLMGSFINTATEADYEAGEAFMTALKAGKSPEEIQDAVNSVRKKNLALLSLTNPLGDVLLFGLGKPLKALAGKIAGKGLLAKAGRAVVERGVPYVLGAAPEGVEGGSQEAFQQQAQGLPLDWEKIKEAAGSEALASLLYGLVGRGLRGGAKVLLGSQADSDGGKPGEPPAPPPGSGETSQTDGKPLSPQERVRSKLLELREKIFNSYLGPGPHYKGVPTDLNWDNMSAAMKKQVVRLRKAMELWDEGKYDESERLASMLKDEMMPEKDTPLWAPVEETAETAEPSMPISEAADQVLAAPPDTETESAAEEKKAAGTIKIGNREIPIYTTDDSDENGPTGGAGGAGILLPGERRGTDTSPAAADTSIPAADTSGTVTDTSTPRERVKTTIRGQLEAIAAQGGEQAKMLGPEEIDAYSTLFAAMAEQAGKRQGISAEEWLQSQNLTITNGMPQFEASSEGTKLNQPVNYGVDLSSVAKGTVISPKFINVDAGSFLKGEGRKQLEESVIGEYRNEDTQWDIVLSRSNVSHAISSALNNQDIPLNISMEVIAELPRLIERARLVESHNDRHKGEHVRKVHRFYTAVQISTEPDSLYKVKLTVKEINEKLEVDVEGIYRAYDARIIEKAPADSRRRKLGEFSTGHATDAFDVILESLLDGVKDSDGKLYLSDNGETRSQSTAALDAEYLAAGESSEQGPVADEVTTRGSTLFGKGRITITMGKAMDRTTLVHEFGHLFLADLFKQAKNGVASAIRDLNVLMSWWTQEASWLAKWISANKYGTFTAEQAARFAGKDGAQPVRDALAGKADPDTAQVVFIAGHEMFARGFERYLSDGKAPNSQLRAVFERFRTWMADVYGKLAGDPNFKLSKDAREVMDRMVGGENASQAGTAKNVSVARNGNETTVTLNDMELFQGARDESGKKISRGVSENIANSFDEKKTWLLSGWKDYGDVKSSGAREEGFDSSGATHQGPTHTRPMMGAEDYENIIPSSEPEDRVQQTKGTPDALNEMELNQSSLDADYFAAVEAGDTAAAQRLVDEAAETAGYTVQHVFHGSKRIDRLGNELKPERATSGPMPFFTDDPTIAENYSKNKADTSLEIPESYTGWFKVAVGRGKPKSIDQAWLYLSLDKRRELSAKLPHVVNTDENGEVADEFRLTDDEYGMTNKSHWEFVLREKRGNILAAAVEIWLDSGELFDQEEKFLEILRLAGLDGVTYDSPWLEQPGVLQAHLAIRKPFDTGNISDDDFAALEAASKGKRGSTNIVDEWDKRRFSGKEWMELLAQDRSDGTTFAWTSVPDWVSRELHRRGYDGIKDQGGKYTGERHTVWIPFFPWQAKRADIITRDDQGNIIPLSKRFDASSPSILYQRTGDEKTPTNKKKQQQALTHKAEETEQARKLTNAPENPWPDEVTPISEQDIEEVFGTTSRAAKAAEAPWPGEGDNVTEADIDEMFSEGSWSPEGFSSAVQAIDDFFTPEKNRSGGEKGPNDPKNRERYDREGNQLSENPKDASYLNPIYTLTSPSLLAKKNKLFAPFFKMAKEAQELQETLRRDFNAVLDKAWGSLSDDQSQALNEILIEGDLRGRTFTDEQLTARGLDEDVRRGYSLIRDLSDRVGKAVRQRQRESGTKVMGWREGYVPHIFHGFFIRLDGRIVDTARSLQEAVELARNVEKDHSGGIVDIVSKPNDFSGSSAYNASALNDRKLLKFSTTMEEAFAFTPDEAERFLKGYDKKAFKNRIFAFSHERLGVKGWDQDMKFAFRHYVNQSARFLAMDELKYKGIGLFEKTWGEFNHEYKGIAKYTKDYLNDVLGVPSNASTQMNEWFKRIPGMYKISKQVFGDRPAEYLASVFTKGMGVAKLGFLNIASAMMNLSQLINASALLGYSDLGLGIRQYFANLTKPSERVTRIYEETGVLDNLNVAAGAGYSKASEKMYGIVGKFLELSMAPFAYMDGMCRKATVLAAYNKAHREGKSHKEAIAYAKEINDRANFDYSVADTPAFLRRSGPLGQVVFQFKKFGIKQLELATGLNGFAQNARFWIPMIALSGLWGLPAAELLKSLFMALFDRDPQAEVNAWMAKEDWIPEPVRRTIQYGVLSNAGVDISKRVGMGDVIPNEVADLLGPTVGTIHRMSPHVATLAGKLMGLEGDGTAAMLNALEALSPGLSNPIKAILGEVEDKKRGRLKFRYQGSGERAVRAMGFRPTREAVESDAVRAANYLEAKRLDREREAIDEYVRARDSGSTKDAAKALARLKELKVTPDRIIRELRERKKGTAYERLQQKLKGQKSQEARKVLQGF